MAAAKDPKATSSGDATSGSVPTPRGESVYVVQHHVQHGDAPTSWEDIATVRVPSRTKRATVIEKALEAAEFAREPGFAVELRVLDEDSARQTVVEWEQPPPRLKIG